MAAGPHRENRCGQGDARQEAWNRPSPTASEGPTQPMPQRQTPSRQDGRKFSFAAQSPQSVWLQDTNTALQVDWGVETRPVQRVSQQASGDIPDGKCDQRPGTRQEQARARWAGEEPGFYPNILGGWARVWVEHRGHLMPTPECAASLLGNYRRAEVTVEGPGRRLLCHPSQVMLLPRAQELVGRFAKQERKAWSQKNPTLEFPFALEYKISSRRLKFPLRRY